MAYPYIEIDTNVLERQINSADFNARAYLLNIKDEISKLLEKSDKEIKQVMIDYIENFDS